MKKINQLAHDGFTLIELLMTILIIAILVLVGITQFTNFSKDAKNATAQANLAILRNAIGVMNAMERIRCGKTSLFFPAVGTLESNDISGCTPVPAAYAAGGGGGGVNVTTAAACFFSNLMDPKFGVVYGVGASAGSGCSPFTNVDYMSLIPIGDRPFVQNVIPPNPWQSSVETTLLQNTVTADTPNAANAGGPCVDEPTYNTIPQLNAKACFTNAVTPFGTAATDGGWCYCVGTGQIWANTANNDGLGTGTGNESLF